MSENFIKSTSEAAEVVKSLETLYHYGRDFKAFTDPYLELIMGRARDVNCSQLHPGRGCVLYALPKLSIQFK